MKSFFFSFFIAAGPKMATTTTTTTKLKDDGGDDERKIGKLSLQEQSVFVAIDVKICRTYRNIGEARGSGKWPWRGVADELSLIFWYVLELDEFQNSSLTIEK